MDRPMTGRRRHLDPTQIGGWGEPISTSFRTACIMRAPCSKASAPMGRDLQVQRAFERAEALGAGPRFSRFPISAAEIDAAKRAGAGEEPAKRIAYVRPVAWRGSEQMGAPPRQQDTSPRPGQWPTTSTRRSRLKGMPPRSREYRRPDPATAPTQAKAAGFY